MCSMGTSLRNTASAASGGTRLTFGGGEGVPPHTSSVKVPGSNPASRLMRDCEPQGPASPKPATTRDELGLPEPHKRPTTRNSQGLYAAILHPKQCQQQLKRNGCDS